jgi:hypothetical protein
MENYDTLIEAIQGLKAQGYVEDFNLKAHCLECQNGAFEIHTDEFQIDKFFRFEGFTDPSDQSIIYAISSDKHQLKGTLVNAYGIYSEDMSDEMMEKLR